MIPQARSFPSSRRRGFGLPEVAITTILLAMAIAMVGQGVVWVANTRRAADRKQRALQEAANLMERIAARPWNELTPEFAKTVTLDPATSTLLNNGTVEVAITPTTENTSPPAKRISVAVRSRDTSGNLQAPVRVATWVHRREGAKP